MISKFAIIGKGAQIGKNVSIGNFTTIEDDVVIGDNTWIGNNVNIFSGVRLGSNCKVYPSAVLGGEPQDLKFKGEYTTLEIGNDNIIREFVTMNKGTATQLRTKIGDSNLFMSNAHIGHDCTIGNHCIIGYSVGMAGEVIVGDWVNISGLTGIHQFSMIGDHSMVSGHSKVVQDIPPYVMAGRNPLGYAGLNVVGLKRRGFSSLKIDELKDIYRSLFYDKRNTSAALEYIESHFDVTAERDNILNFVRKSSRGIIRATSDEKQDSANFI